MRRGPQHASGGGTTTAIKHLRFGRTNFGTQPTGADLTWGWGAPLNRFTYTMNGSAATLHAINPGCLTTPYALHHFTEATGQEATDNNTVSWGTLASSWATTNGKNVESIFLHAAVGQLTNSAVVASVTTGGLIALGVNPTNAKQMQAQGRSGVAASDAFLPGQSYTLTTTSPVQTVTVTVQSIPSLTTIQTDYAGAAATGGTIARVGDGTLTFANRIFFESESDWAWATNFQNADAQAFQVYRMGQIMADGSDGVFFDSHYAGNMHWQSFEYGTSGGSQAYINDVCTCLGLYRSTYPGKLFFPNIANFVTAQDAQIADAAGACQQEGGINLFNTNAFPTGGTVDFTIARLAAGTLSEVSTHPDFNTAEPHAGIQGAPTLYNSSGGNHFTTAADRAIMAQYAAVLMMVNQGQPKRLYFDPANDNWAVFPLSARWETGFETPLGEPVDSLTPPKFLYASGTDASGKGGHVYARLFSKDGTQATDLTALVLFRRYDGNTAAYDATTAMAVNIAYTPPAGMVWGVMDDTGAVTGSIRAGDTVQLWNPDALFLVPTTPSTGRSWFVSPTGASTNAGTSGSPWDLATACAGGSAGQIAGGDTVWLAPGNYSPGNTTLYTISISGVVGNPVTFRNLAGGRVTIDGYFTINGSDVDVWGIETFSSDTDRVSAQTLSFPTDLPRANYQNTVNGARSRMIHCVVHDLGNGIVPNESNVNGTIYGCLSYNNGWDAPDRGHGHGIYAQSTTAGRKTIQNNIVFNQFDYGMQLFSQSTHSDNVTFDRNITFTNGSLSGEGAADWTLGTTENPMQGLVLTNNCSYMTSEALVADIGRDDGPDAVTGTVTGNRFAGRVRYKFWTSLTNTGNEYFGGNPQTVSIELSSDETFAGKTWDNNTYWQDAEGDAPTSFGTVQAAPIGGQEWTFANWKATTGYDAHSTFTATLPTGQRITVNPSAFTPGRAHVAVFNWSGATTATLDLSGVLTVGHTYQILNACDFYGPPVQTGTYAGGTLTVTLPATVTPVAAVGGSTNPAPNIAPTFYAFVVLDSSAQ